MTALAYVHDRQIVHRDVKPENLIFDERGQVLKLVDFGLSERLLEEKKLELPCGSPGFVAPEVVTQPPSGYDTKADVFSAGCVLFMLLTGEETFSGKDAKEVFLNNQSMNITTGRFIWEGVSEAARNLCLLMLLADPAR